jgi:hypothetical protein
MKTLVIHPKDSSTDFLSTIYSDKDWTVINTNTSKKFLKEQIKLHDRIIMLGHGTPCGLLGFNRFVIDSTLVYLLREKDCVCIWCNADLFVEKYKLKGFYTGMIISEFEEAMYFTVRTDDDDIDFSNSLFANAIKESIDNVDMLSNVKRIYDGVSPVITYNKKNLYYS